MSASVLNGFLYGQRMCIAWITSRAPYEEPRSRTDRMKTGPFYVRYIVRRTCLNRNQEIKIAFCCYYTMTISILLIVKKTQYTNSRNKLFSIITLVWGPRSTGICIWNRFPFMVSQFPTPRARTEPPFHTTCPITGTCQACTRSSNP